MIVAKEVQWDMKLHLHLPSPSKGRTKAVCTVSGGLDSAVAAALVMRGGFEPHFLFFDWGQKTLPKERECARSLAAYFHVPFSEIDVSILKILPGVSLTQAETLTTAINEYVPNRNAILETQAIAFAEYLKAGLVCVGSTGGDHICPDNSSRFVAAMQQLILEGTLLKPAIQIVAPLLTTDKAGAVQLGKDLGVPFHLTWSCHNRSDIACARCSNCESRLAAFAMNHRHDPIAYAKPESKSA